MSRRKSKADRRLLQIARRAERLKQTLVQRIERERAFTETVPRPQEPGDRCWQCGYVTVYKETKRKPKAGQDYAYRGYLFCDGCKRMYLCDQFKYFLA